MSGGFAALARGAPDMNSLVGLGATAAFAVSAAAALLPQLGECAWPARGGAVATHTRLLSIVTPPSHTPPIYTQKP